MYRFILAFLALFAAISSAAPVSWPVDEGGNGHYYEVRLCYAESWWDVMEAASAFSYGGYTGHLATITSIEENNWILANVPVPPSQMGSASFWLGAWDASDIQNDDGMEGWQWVTGEAWSFEEWSVYEPSNGQFEWVLSYHYYYEERLGFNDVNPNFAWLAWYMIEYDEFDVVSMPPLEPVYTSRCTWGGLKALYR
jgi:hypothetical protein